jgi:nucleoside-diphosphate-sugar epimerase
MSRRVLVTGATGFIGKHLVRMLAERGDAVTCLVRATSRRDDLSELGVRFAEGDLLDQDALRAAAADQDEVYHLAALLKAPWRATFGTVNAEGAGNVARACAEQPAPPVLIAVSSLAAAGPRAKPEPRAESDPPGPVARYGRAKLQGERAVAEHAAALPVTIVRPPMVLGEGDQAALALFKMAARGVFVVPSWRGSRVSMIHVTDLCDLLLRAAEKGERVDPGSDDPGSGVYFATADEALAFADLGRRIGAGLGRRTRVMHVPSLVTWGVAAMGEAWGRLRDKPTILNLDKAHEGLAGDWEATSAKAHEQLGFRPLATVDERLAQTASWYREQGWI